MTEQGAAEHAPGLFPVPGDGVLARRADLILLCGLEVSQIADDLLDLLEQVAAAGGDGRQFTDAVAGALDAGSPGAGGDAPAVLAFGPAADGLAVTVSGGAWADIATGDGTVRVEAGHPRMLLRAALRCPATGIRGGLSADDNGAASTDRFSRLDAGTVRAGGLSFYQAAGAATAGGGAGAGGAGVGMRKGPRSRPEPEPDAAPPVTGLAHARTVAEPVPVAEPPSPEPPQPGPPPLEPPQPGPPLAEPFPAGPAYAEFAGAGGETGEPPAADAGAGAAPAGVAFEPTAAWASPDLAPAEAQDAEHRATELWTPPPGEPVPGEPVPGAPVPGEPVPGQYGSGQPGPGGGPAGGGGYGMAEDLEREVTEPPGPYGDGPQEYPPGVGGEPFEAVLLLDGGRASGIEEPPRPALSKVRDLPPGTSSYVSAGPIIQGVYCKNGHFDDPEALFCAICGISMNQQTLVPRPGERPPLGVLLLDDGSVFQLDSDYVIGREPSLDSSVAAGKARPLRVSDDTGIVSRVHARIHLEGWRVLVTDLGSANGTRVLLPGQPADQPLMPQMPMMLATGSQVDLGGRAFRYESHRGR